MKHLQRVRAFLGGLHRLKQGATAATATATGNLGIGSPHSRRTFLVGTVLGAGASTVFKAVVSGSSESVTGKIIDGRLAARSDNPTTSSNAPHAVEHVAEPKIIRAIGELISVSGDLRFHAGSAHYSVQGVHSDNSSTEAALVKLLETPDGKGISTYGRHEVVDACDTILIGAPSSNKLARDQLGFGGDLFGKSRTPANLRYEYVYRDTNRELGRFRASGELQSVTKVAVIHDRKTQNKFEASVDANKMQEDDWLLLTCQLVQHNGRMYSRVVLGGLHGVATRASAELLQLIASDRDLCNQLRSGNSRTFQVLAKVDVKHVANQSLGERLRIVERHVA